MAAVVTIEKHKTWTRLFAEKGASLNSYFLRRVAHRWDAQDLVQEVYLRMLRADHDEEAPIRNPEAYLFTIAANLVKEHAVGRQRAPVSSEGMEDLIDRLATPCEAEGHIDRDVRRQRLGMLIARLSPKCRAVLVMHYRDELPYREIGEKLSISTHMVKKYIVKGLTACRQGMALYD
jgi:RNA polymerase sigma factor (sigma-70 family)